MSLTVSEASWTEVRPLASISLAVAVRKRSRSTSVHGGTTSTAKLVRRIGWKDQRQLKLYAQIRAMALSTKTPLGAPDGVRTISPPGTEFGGVPIFEMMEGDTQSACTSTLRRTCQLFSAAR